MGRNVCTLGGAINALATAFQTIRENVAVMKKAVSFIYSNTRGLRLVYQHIKNKGLDFDQVAMKVICSNVGINVLLSRSS